MESYKELIVWQKSMALVTKVYKLTNDFPDEEKFGLTNQMRRDDFFYDISDNDLCNIISSLSDLHYKDDKLYDILHEHVKIAADDIKPYGLFMIIQSYARVIPHKRDYYFDLYEP